MALVRSRSAELFQNKTMTSTTRQLQQALYHLLDELEKSAFIEALGLYRTHRDIFELVNGLRKMLNTPVKRQLFPLVRKVIRQEHVEAFDLITKDVKHHNTITVPYLYRPHMADLNVLSKYRAAKTPTHHRNPLIRSWAGTAAEKQDKTAGALFRKSATLQRASRVKKQDIKHKTLSTRSPGSNEDTEAQILEVDLGEPDSEEEGYGFTIRGGVEVGVGVHVSSVNNESPAQRAGLNAGDLILEANNISFRSIPHEEAARIIKAATRLRVTVSRVGRIPSSHAIHEAYTWTDPKGRPVSPPLERGGSAPGDDADERRRSASQMLTASDERKINIVVQRSHGLGILIRGGKEYNLGIFVSGIDPFSAAENAGMKLGDQILDVNGRSFLDITHAEAVSILQSSRHLIITVKDVGKIPFAKTTIDERGWIESTRVGFDANSLSWSSRKSISGSLTDQDTKKKIFSRGVGTQLMLTSSMGKAKHKEQIYDQAKLLLNDSEHSTLNYYLLEYEKKTINIRGMAHALLELLNTPAKLTLMSEIRVTVRPGDLATFDQLVAKRDLEKSLNQARKLLAPDMISLSSFDSDDVIGGEKYKRTMFSHPKSVLFKPQPMDILDFDEDGEVASDSYDLLETQRLSRSTPDLTSLHQIYQSQQPIRTTSNSRSPWSAHPTYRKPTSDALNNMGSRTEIINFDPEFTKPKTDYPSDDSGVEINGHARQDPLPGSYPGMSEHVTLYNVSRAHTTREVNSKELSGPQKKILSHLQLRKAQEAQQTISNKNARNHHTETKPRPKPSSAETKGFHNVVEHKAEVHESPGSSSDNEDARDLTDLSPQDPSRGSSAEPSRNDAYIALAPNATSRRPPHRNRLKDKSRPRSKSKSRGIEDVDDAKESGQRHQVTQSSTLGFVHGDTILSQNKSSLYQNEDHGDATSKQPSTLFNLSLKPRPRKDKSAFTQIWRNLKHNGNSSSAATASRNQDGGLTINGQLISSPSHDSGESSALTGHNQHAEEEQNNDNEVFLILGSHDDHEADVDISQISGNINTSKPTTTNHKSKGVLFARGRKSLTNETSPTKAGGVSSSRYKSPRRDKQVSRINVPLIKVDNTSNDKHNGVPLAPPLDGNGGDAKEGGNFLTVIQYNGPTMEKRKSAARMTTADQAADPAADGLGRDLTITDRGSSVDQGRNVTSISVGAASSQDPSSQSVEAIKRQAREKYGEIPLDIVYIYRSKPTLGVAIEGGANTRQPLPKVISVQPGGSAFESGGLKVGHVILEVNGQPVVGLSHMDAARLIAEAFKNRNYNRMELLVTDWADALLDAIKVDVGMLKSR